jgi:hypothetical protein
MLMSMIIYTYTVKVNTILFCGSSVKINCYFAIKKKLYKLIGTCMDCGEHWLIFTLYSTVLYINVQMFKFT